MKRMHIHVSVSDLETSVRFYSTLFAAEPTVRKVDYAKWMLEDPRVNFAISQRGAATGVEHLGIQVEDGAELQDVYTRLKRADRPVLEEGNTTCCYAESEKSWIEDPQGIQWETFLTTGESTVYGHDPVRTAAPDPSSAACCGGSRCAPDATGTVTIYYNPACGTSRNTLALIRNAGIEPSVIEYLKTPPDRDRLVGLLQRMNARPRAILREKGTPYADLGLDSPELTDEQLIEAMLAHPILINRPIVVTSWGVKLCRPSETVLDILPVPQKGAFTKEDGERVVDERGQRIR